MFTCSEPVISLLGTHPGRLKRLVYGHRGTCRQLLLQRRCNGKTGSNHNHLNIVHKFQCSGYVDLISSKSQSLDRTWLLPFFVLFLDLFIHLKGWEERERYLTPGGLLLKWLQWPALGQVIARSLKSHLGLHVGGRSYLGHCPLLPQTRSRVRNEAVELEVGLIWDPGIAGSSLTHSASLLTMLREGSSTQLLRCSKLGFFFLLPGGYIVFTLRKSSFFAFISVWDTLLA